ncbi:MULTISPECIES: oxygenase MpaB family protein [unclassified Novosphingobium]|uniref:oxygenase MpaB family protein n=1 Tax=unclassified Novosphingobium TaxID=2644732 RepID=UPI000ED00F47|nr:MULTISPECIES: oxygenase MpaB family protein [unclassified Novosphingobium]HCF24442.1 histidine kinase [Novosphingobium sp.]HQV04975.1 oxygenase MpaB family protein [Novosphingobium sp.]
MSKPAARPIPPFDYSQPPGAAALMHPGSVAWRIYKNQIALAIGGVAAVLMEFADPRIRSGVWDHSIYPVDPIGRSQRTGHAAMIGVYGPADAARKLIAGVGRMHAKVAGETPGGVAYKATDPELVDWVSATAGYGFLTAYHTFVSPVSEADQNRFFREGEAVAVLYGVQKKLTCRADFFAMMEGLAAGFEPHPINREFLDIIQSGKAAPTVPRFLHRALARAAVSILPPLIRERLELGREYNLSFADRAAVKLIARLAERKHDPASPPAQASVRHGLPSDFLWRKRPEQLRLLEGLGLEAA